MLFRSQQNGRAECFNRTLFEKAEAMCHMACLPKSWWEFCVEYTVHVYNRMPMQWLKYMSPYELLLRRVEQAFHSKIKLENEVIVKREFQVRDLLLTR